eukprot:scpid57907/ scgid20322/ 
MGNQLTACARDQDDLPQPQAQQHLLYPRTRSISTQTESAPGIQAQESPAQELPREVGRQPDTVGPSASARARPNAPTNDEDTAQEIGYAGAAVADKSRGVFKPGDSQKLSYLYPPSEDQIYSLTSPARRLLNVPSKPIPLAERAPGTRGQNRALDQWDGIELQTLAAPRPVPPRLDNEANVLEWIPSLPSPDSRTQSPRLHVERGFLSPAKDKHSQKAAARSTQGKEWPTPEEQHHRTESLGKSKLQPPLKTPAEMLKPARRSSKLAETSEPQSEPTEPAEIPEAEGACAKQRESSEPTAIPRAEAARAEAADKPHQWKSSLTRQLDENYHMKPWAGGAGDKQPESGHASPQYPQGPLKKAPAMEAILKEYHPRTPPLIQKMWIDMARPADYKTPAASPSPRAKASIGAALNLVPDPEKGEGECDSCDFEMSL